MNKIKVVGFSGDDKTKPLHQIDGGKEVSLREVLNAVVNSYKLKVKVEYIRSKTEREEVTKAKSELPVFKTHTLGASRNDKTELTGIMVFDYDKVENPKALKDALVLNQALSPYILFSFVSPSGRGVAVGVLNPEGTTVENFKEVYRAVGDIIDKNLTKDLGVPTNYDRACNDLGRIRYLSYDPDANYHVNAYPFPFPKSLQQQAQAEPVTSTSTPESTPSVSVSNDNTQTGGALPKPWMTKFFQSQCWVGKLNDRDTWLRFCAAFIDAGGTFEAFDYISSKSSGYTGQDDCRKLWDDLVRRAQTGDGKGITSGTLVHFAKEWGFNEPTRTKYNTKKKSNNDDDDDSVPKKHEHLLAWYDATFEVQYVPMGRQFRWRKVGAGVWEFGGQDRLETIISAEFQSQFLSILSTSSLRAFIQLVQATRTVDPLKEFVDGLDTVSVEYAEQFFVDLAKTMDVENPAYAARMVSTWAASAVKMWLNPASQEHLSEYVLVLQGGQNTGKSFFANKISRGVPYSSMMNSTEINDESQLLLADSSILVLDELKQLVSTKSSANAFKAFVSTPELTVRRKYARDAERYARRAALIGSINETEFLSDPTGSRRFLIIKKLSQGGELPDARLFWACAKAISTVRWRLSNAELDQMQAKNKDYTVTTAEAELVDIVHNPSGRHAVVVKMSALTALAKQKGLTVKMNPLVEELRKRGIERKWYKVNGSSEKGYLVTVTDEMFQTLVNGSISSGGDVLYRNDNRWDCPNYNSGTVSIITILERSIKSSPMFFEQNS